MRVLLIDNHDSYTFNLAQLMAREYGRMPSVIRNDDPALLEVDLSAFDAIVVSPGPGRPQEPRDLGLSAALLRTAALPVLGVCLGHQAIGWLSGAWVGPAPLPRHGFVDRISHTGTGLFEGLPQGFAGVRYHSLCVAAEGVPELETTAWTRDGVVMGLRHRSRPWWGVQFHPESVGTRHGARLVENFAALVRGDRAVTLAPPPLPSSAPAPASPPSPPSQSSRFSPPSPPSLSSQSSRSSRPPSPSPSALPAPPSPASPTAPGTSGTWRLRVRTLAFEADTEQVFRRWFAPEPSAFWLDSSRVEEGLSRFSFAGFAGGPHGERLAYRAGSGRVSSTRADGTTTWLPGSVYDVLAARLRERALGEDPGLPFDLDGGYVGFLGYEMKAESTGRAAHRSELPDAVWLSATRFVAVDHLEHRTYVAALAGPADGDTAEADRWVDALATVLDESRTPDAQPATGPSTGPFGGPPDGHLTGPLAGPLSGRPAGPPAGPVAGLPPEPPVGGIERWLARPREHYLADIAECDRLLRAGESYEICLTDTLRVPYTADPLDFYARQRRLNPAPYAAYLQWDGYRVACSSPERFLRIGRDRVAESKPIKGTAPRHPDPDLDRVVREELAADPKSRAENMMIVDLIRNDLGQVCEIGTVEVPRLMAVESYATVHQLVSTVRGRLREDVDALTATRHCFPGGSMTGAPKIRTMEIIDRLEGAPRGVYSGTLGYFALSGAADLNIVIRTAVSDGRHLSVGAGGAIVLDSDPAAEYEEMLLKAHAALRPLLGSQLDPLPAAEPARQSR
ncbi:chorismate-binding protein [Nonomuraea longicatena]|uniref:aminodeoxychorismate synthase n=1 Tax=Nonomuraea longicatena TaxID=83682 RepID=A0ABN1Q3A2_9ACTN